MKPIHLYVSILSLFCTCTSKPADTQPYSKEDSVFLFTNFLNYDERFGTFGDVDEPSVFDYWNDSREEAIRHFSIAVEIKSIPPAQRMIFASYLSDVEVDQPVRDILSGLNDEWEIREVYNIMDSYGVSFKKFGVSESAVQKCCPDLEYH